MPIDAGELKGEGCKTDDLDAHSVWSISQTAAVFVARYKSLKDECKAEGKSLAFDKDVDPIMDFVTCAANLRSKCYGIELQTLHRVQVRFSSALRYKCVSIYGDRASDVAPDRA